MLDLEGEAIRKGQLLAFGSIASHIAGLDSRQLDDRAAMTDLRKWIVKQVDILCGAPVEVELCGALSRMNDVCNLSKHPEGTWHTYTSPHGGRVEWRRDHTFPCDCGDCHNSQPAVAEKGV